MCSKKVMVAEKEKQRISECVIEHLQRAEPFTKTSVADLIKQCYKKDHKLRKGREKRRIVKDCCTTLVENNRIVTTVEWDGNLCKNVYSIKPQTRSTSSSSIASTRSSQSETKLPPQRGAAERVEELLKKDGKENVKDIAFILTGKKYEPLKANGDPCTTCGVRLLQLSDADQRDDFTAIKTLCNIYRDPRNIMHKDPLECPLIVLGASPTDKCITRPLQLICEVQGQGVKTSPPQELYTGLMQMPKECTPESVAKFIAKSKFLSAFCPLIKKEGSLSLKPVRANTATNKVNEKEFHKVQVYDVNVNALVGGTISTTADHQNEDAMASHIGYLRGTPHSNVHHDTTFSSKCIPGDAEQTARSESGGKYNDERVATAAVGVLIGGMPKVFVFGKQASFTKIRRGLAKELDEQNRQDLTEPQKKWLESQRAQKHQPVFIGQYSAPDMSPSALHRAGLGECAHEVPANAMYYIPERVYHAAYNTISNGCMENRMMTNTQLDSKNCDSIAWDVAFESIEKQLGQMPDPKPELARPKRHKA